MTGSDASRLDGFGRRPARWAAGAMGVVALAGILTGCGGHSQGVSVLGSGMPPDLPNGHYPVTISDCGVTTTYTHAPTRVITIEESSTEFMLALGLQSHMIGTAYIDSPILAQYQAAYHKIPVLSQTSVSEEVVLSKHPDFVYGAYADQFVASGGESGTRESLHSAGVNTFLSPADCLASSLGNHQISFDTIWTEIRDLGEIFGVENRADALIAAQQKQLSQLTAHGLPMKGTKVFWFDSGPTPPYVGACCGVPELLMKTLGAINIFQGAPGGWANGNYETVVSSNPDVIVFDNAVWDTSANKANYLQSYPATKGLPAVVHRDYIPIDFAYVTPSVRNVSALAILVQEFDRLHLK